MLPEQANAPVPFQSEEAKSTPFWERKIIWIPLALIILLGAGVYLFTQQSTSKTDPQSGALTSEQVSTVQNPAPPSDFWDLGCKKQQELEVCHAAFENKYYETRDGWKTMRVVDISVAVPRPEPDYLTDVPAGVHARIEYVGNPQQSKFCSYYKEQLVISTPKWPDKVFPLGACAMAPFSLRISPTGNLIELWTSQYEGEEAFVFNLINGTTIISGGEIDVVAAQINYFQHSPIIWLPDRDGFVMSASGVNANGDSEEGIYLWLSTSPTRLRTIATVPDPTYSGPRVTTLGNLHLSSGSTAINYSVIVEDEQSGNIIEQVDKSFPI